MTTSTYVLARFTSLEKLVPAIKTIEGCRSMVRWNAVDGHVNMVIKFNVASSALPDSIKKLDGIQELLAYEVADNYTASAPLKPDSLYTYVFVETESAKKTQIKKIIDNWENIHSCEPTSGGCDLIVLIEGENFQEIDRIIKEKIHPLDGILRIKIDKVINLKQI